MVFAPQGTNRFGAHRRSIVFRPKSPTRSRLQQIRLIFVYEGALIGASGTAIGLALGYALCHFADKYRWLKLNGEVYALSYVPFDSRWVDGLWIAAGAMAISLIATLYPAWNATRIAPAEALRYQ